MSQKLHSYLHSFTFENSNTRIINCLPQTRKHLKSPVLNGTCGFDPHPGHLSTICDEEFARGCE